MSAVERPDSARTVQSRSSDEMLRLPRSLIRLQSPELPEPEDFEVGFLEEILRGDPCEESSLILLAHLYTQRGEYAKGLALDGRLAKLRPEDPIVFYNLACSFALQGRLDEAFMALERAVALGYRELAHMLSDPDLEQLRADPRFNSFCRRLGLLKPGQSVG